MLGGSNFTINYAEPEAMLTRLCLPHMLHLSGLSAEPFDQKAVS